MQIKVESKPKFSTTPELYQHNAGVLIKKPRTERNGAKLLILLALHGLIDVTT
jgi:hypothetical protein